MAVAASLLLLASLTAAAMVPAVRQRLSLFGHAPAEPARSAIAPRLRPATAADAADPASAKAGPAAAPEPVKPAPREPPGERAPRPAVARTGRAAPAADLLFSQANAARRDADVPRAAALYHELERLHPAAPEALVSRVALGRLLLERAGDARGALAEFDGYLARAPRGALAEEALFGKASALLRLGRTAEEQDTWRLLVERFPRSVYADRARARLEPPR